MNGKPFLDTFGLVAESDANTIGTIVAIYESRARVTQDETRELTKQSDVCLVRTSELHVLIPTGFIGSLCSAFYADKLGRRWTIILGSVLMIVGAILQASALSRAQIIIGRIISGLGMGHINATVPILQAEMSTPKSRGRSGMHLALQASLDPLMSHSMHSIVDSKCRYHACVLGILVHGSCLVLADSIRSTMACPSSRQVRNSSLSHSESDLQEERWQWRIPIALQVFFIMILIVLAVLIPESPRWLAAHGREEEALQVITRLAASNSQNVNVNAVWTGILDAVRTAQESPRSPWVNILKSDHLRSRRRFLIACGIQAAQQMGGINVSPEGRVLGLISRLISIGTHILFWYHLPAVFEIVQQCCKSDFRLPEYLVLSGLIRPALSDRSSWAQKVAAHHDHRHGRLLRVRTASQPELSLIWQDRGRPHQKNRGNCRGNESPRYRSSHSHLHLPSPVHDRIPSSRLGNPC